MRADATTGIGPSMPTRYPPRTSTKYGSKYPGKFMPKYAAKQAPKYVQPRRPKPPPPRTMPGVILSIAVFFLALVGGLTFLGLVIDSHFYHELIDEAFFNAKRPIKTFDASRLRADWHMSLKANDVRKAGEVADAFEVNTLAELTEQIHDITNIGNVEERQRALADFSARVTSNQADIAHITDELRGLREKGLDGQPEELAGIDASLTRLRRATDMLAVVRAELDAEPDKVTLHDIHKQLGGVLDSIKPKPPRPEAAAGH
jgi:hypothetical protein